LNSGHAKFYFAAKKSPLIFKGESLSRSFYAENLGYCKLLCKRRKTPGVFLSNLQFFIFVCIFILHFSLWRAMIVFKLWRKKEA